MDIHQIRVFHVASLTGSFTQASQQLHLSQSTISQHIKLLESELGCLLFSRSGKRVVLTEAGEILRTHCERILQEVSNAEMAIKELNGMKRGKVRFGTGATTLIYQLPPVLEAYRTKYPQIELVILSDTTDQILKEIRGHRLDLGLVMMNTTEDDLSFTPLWQEELLVALPVKHTLSKQKVLSVEDLRQLRFILYEQKTVMRQLIDHFFAKLEVRPQIAMVMENIEAIKSLVSTGLGASILPASSVGTDKLDKKLRLMRVEGHKLNRKLGLVRLKTSVTSNATQALHDLIVSQKPKLTREASS